MASLQTRGDYWHACFRDAHGKQRQRSTKVKVVRGHGRDEFETSKRRAMSSAQAMERAARGEVGDIAKLRRTLEDLVALSQGSAPTDTIEMWSNDWLAARKLKVEKSSYGAAVKTLGALMDHTGKDASLSSIHPKQIQHVLDTFGKSLAAGTVIKRRKILSKCFADAMRAGMVERNPVAATSAPKDETIHRVNFTDDDIAKIMAVSSEEWQRVIIAALDTGLRLSDVTQLGRDCYNEKSNAIEFTASKNGFVLTIPTTPRLREIVKAHDQIAPKLRTQESGVLGVKFAIILKNSKIDRMATKEGKNTVYRKSFHSFRHTFISRLANAGVDPEIRKKLAGHKSSDVHDIYTHHNLDRLRAAMEKI